MGGLLSFPRTGRTPRAPFNYASAPTLMPRALDIESFHGARLTVGAVYDRAYSCATSTLCAKPC